MSGKNGITVAVGQKVRLLELALQSRPQQRWMGPLFYHCCLLRYHVFVQSLKVVQQASFDADTASARQFGFSRSRTLNAVFVFEGSAKLVKQSFET